jgi:hypothetical protein
MGRGIKGEGFVNLTVARSLPYTRTCVPLIPLQRFQIRTLPKPPFLDKNPRKQERFAMQGHAQLDFLLRKTTSGRSYCSTRMKFPLIAAFMFFTLSCGYAGDPNVSGSMSGFLNLTLSFDARSEQFLITLRNTSSNSLSIAFQPTNFQGYIVVEAKGKVPRKYYEKRFRTMMLTSQWIVPRQKLTAGGIIAWEQPVAELRDIQDNQLRLQELDGASAWAEVEQIAIVPPGGNYIVNNARQKSPKINIEVEPDGAANRSQPVRPDTNRASSAAGPGR